MPSTTVRPPGRVATSSPRETPGPTASRAPDPQDPQPSARRSRFLPPAGTGPHRPDVRTGIVVSVVFHVVLLVVLVMTDVVRLPDLDALLAERAAQAAGAERVVLIPIDAWAGARASGAPAPASATGAAEAPPLRLPAPTPEPGIPVPRPTDVPVAPPPAGGAPGAAQDGVVGGGETGTPTPARDRFTAALEALRPRLLDPRLRPGSIDALRTDEERAALRAYARINALNDSLLAEIEAGRRATDWTFTDDQGRRWGVSPGKLHLGGIEIPLPLSFAPSREQQARIREWQELQWQSEQGLIDETFDDRVEAIREQRERERGDD